MKAAATETQRRFMSNNDTSNNVPADTVSKQWKLEAIG
jgi:hypothetical protein